MSLILREGKVVLVLFGDGGELKVFLCHQLYKVINIKNLNSCWKIKLKEFSIILHILSLSVCKL